MFDDITYLKLFVSPTEPWDALIRQLYSKKISKKEVQNRIAFVITSADKGKVNTDKGDMWLSACDTFPQYQAGGNWLEEYNLIKNTDRNIAETRTQLAKIPYLKPELVSKDSKTYAAFRFLVDEWNIPEAQAAEEVSLYGMLIIDKFATLKQAYRKKTGRYHFVRALHQFAADQGYDMVQHKAGEGERLFYD